MTIYIDLPPDDAIDCQSFLHAISIATHPALEDIKGIDCVIGKNAPLPTDMLNFGFTVPLTEKDKADLLPLLVDLPKLHRKMTDSDSDNFLYLYSVLPNRLTWLPVLKRRVDPWDLNVLRLECRAEHRNELQERLNQGKIQANDAGHFPVKQIGIGVYIPRSQAVTYLTDCGIKIGSISQTKDSNDHEPRVVANAAITEVGVNIDDGEKAVDKLPYRNHKGTQDQWSHEEKEQLNKDYERLNKNATATAKVYGLTRQRVSELLNELKALKSSQRNDTVKYWKGL
jgi:hypothetical protein